MASGTKPMDATYWRTRAEEARAEADGIREPRAKRRLLEIADNYEQLAEQAAARDKSDTAKPRG